jgi:TolA-binding protein
LASVLTFASVLGFASALAFGSVLALPLPAHGTPAEFAAASEAYRNKNYETAAKQFLDILVREPNNASAAYYAGYSLYGAKKLEEARNILWYLAKQLPTTREAYTARNFLKSIDATSLKIHKIRPLESCRHQLSTSLT